ncbi:hypothetical protein PUN28_004056 [Cardiocondyla obscurior]|uniref:Uncharacterized protein n=1 Tax=Cardiocondyla obscurior TaxID=286306 RepID=A0AAW2GNR5_9HYME
MFVFYRFQLFPIFFYVNIQQKCNVYNLVISVIIKYIYNYKIKYILFFRTPRSSCDSLPLPSSLSFFFYLSLRPLATSRQPTITNILYHDVPLT